MQGQARDQAWSGTAHALVGELGVGAVTHSALQLALGIAALLAGLGVVTLAMGVAFLWHTRQTLAAEAAAVTMAVPDRASVTNGGMTDAEASVGAAH